MKIKVIYIFVLIIAIAVTVFITKTVVEKNGNGSVENRVEEEEIAEETVEEIVETKQKIERLSFELPEGCTLEKEVNCKVFHTPDYVSVSVEAQKYSMGATEEQLEELFDEDKKIISKIGAENPVFEKRTINGNEWNYINLKLSDTSGDFGHEIIRERYYIFHNGYYYKVFISYQTDIEGSKETAEKITNSLILK